MQTHRHLCFTPDSERRAKAMMRGGQRDREPSPPEPGNIPLKSRLLAVLLLVFCCWHAVFLIISVVPRHLRERLDKEATGGDPPVKPRNPDQDGRSNPAMDFYRLLTGGRQEWNVFNTIPLLHSLDARIEVEDGAGGSGTVGCVLPDLRAYPKPELSRYYVLLYGLLLTSPGPSFFEAYLRNAEHLLANRRGPGIIGHWSLVVDAEYTRTLIHSRRDGVLTVPATRTFTPANPRGTAP